MKDQQGTHIINPETMFIIRNLRQKALSEGKDREHYINCFLADHALKMQIERLSSMAAFEEYGQKWCIEQGIIGYDYICNVNLNVRRKKDE